MNRTVNRYPAINTSVSDYKVFILNDMHFVAGTEGNPAAAGAVGGNRYYYASPKLLRDFVNVANTEKPDMILLLGDICDMPSDWALFNEIWSGLDDSIPRAITIGNHDLDIEGYGELLDILRYKGKTENGGSKFNQTYTLNHRNCEVRFIILDATFDANNAHGSHFSNVRFHTDTLQWLGQVLESSKEEFVFIATHVAPHQDGYFDATQKPLVKTVVDTAISNNPSLKVNWLFGHQHELDIISYSNLGTKNKGHLMPSMILELDGRFTEMTVRSNGFNFTKRELKY